MTAKGRTTKSLPGYRRGFVTEDGKHYRTELQELGPVMDRVKRIQEAQLASPKTVTGRHYIGSVPMVVLIDWLKERGYTMDQWARNEGGTPCPPGADPVAHAAMDRGIKSEFLRYFLSRDFSKLHTQHVTTKRERSQIIMPGERHADHLRGTEVRDS